MATSQAIEKSKKAKTENSVYVKIIVKVLHYKQL